MSAIWKNWIISLLIVAIISSVVQIVFVGGKNEKTVKKCMGIVLSVIIIAPIPLVLSKAKSFKDTFDYIYKHDSGYEEYTKQYVFSFLEEAIVCELEKTAIYGAEVSIVGEGAGANVEINYVVIKLGEQGIAENNGHINNRENIVNAVVKVVAVPEEKIIIHERVF